ncbi:hypothetical protein [Pelagerythrobacter sp.]|uniref:hypothetical protein n=1 Tax=Pelagerythrobacter sp. TaxID=2800702 RepID=UPI0035B35228
MRIGWIIGALACTAASGLAAQDTRGISRAVYVERIATAPGGESVRTIEPARALRRGDTVVLVVEWRGTSRGEPVIVSSAVPRPLAFQQASSDAVEVSVDGGRNWGRIGAMRVDDRDGRRLASPEDVTHLRWRSATGATRLTYSAIVR